MRTPSESLRGCQRWTCGRLSGAAAFHAGISPHSSSMPRSCRPIPTSARAAVLERSFSSLTSSRVFLCLHILSYTFSHARLSTASSRATLLYSSNLRAFRLSDTSNGVSICCPDDLSATLSESLLDFRGIVLGLFAGWLGAGDDSRLRRDESVEM